MAKAKKNYREMADDELARELEGHVKGLFNLRVRKVTDVVENPAAFRQHRREVARIKTELRARELKKTAGKKDASAPARAEGSASGKVEAPAEESKAR